MAQLCTFYKVLQCQTKQNTLLWGKQTEGRGGAKSVISDLTQEQFYKDLKSAYRAVSHLWKICEKVGKSAKDLKIF